MSTVRKDNQIIFGGLSIGNYLMSASSATFNSGWSITGSSVTLNRTLDITSPNLENVVQVLCTLIHDILHSRAS